MGKALCENCERELEEERKRQAAEREERRREQEQAYRSALAPLFEGPMAAVEAFPQIREAQPGPDLDSEAVLGIQREALHTMAAKVMQDGRLSAWEETILNNMGGAFGARKGDAWTPQFSDLEPIAALGRANDARLRGYRLPPSVPARKDELAHLLIPAVKLDEVRAKELVLDQNAVSFEFRDGIAYQRGRLTGTEREVSQGVQEVDRGQLLVTSQRVVFIGQQASEELPLLKLLGVQVHGDVVQFRISGRKRYPTLRLGQWADAVVATVNAATQVANGVVPHNSWLDIPEMPDASDECEALLKRGRDAAATVGEVMQEWELRQVRLLFRLGWVDLPSLEKRIAGNEEVAHDFLQCGSPGGPAAPGVGGPPAPAPPVDERPIAEAVGEDYTIAITSFSNLDQNPPGATPFGRFSVLGVVLTNTSKAPQPFYGRSLLLKGPDGTVYEAWTGGAENAIALGPVVGELLLSERLQPHLPQPGAVVFDLPPEAEVASVEAPLSLASRPDDGTISLPLPPNPAEAGDPR